MSAILLFLLINGVGVVGYQSTHETQTRRQLRSHNHQATRGDARTQPNVNTTAAVFTASADALRLPETHQSVFQQHLTAVDVPFFWRVFLSVVLIIACVERAQSYAYWWAEENRTLEKFVDSVCRELMMFGFVAVGLFLFTELFMKLDEETYALFELVDLTLSLTAWSLIIMAGIFMGWANIRRNQWLALHTGLSQNEAEVEAFNSLSWFFKRRMKLKPDFLFHWYLDECLAFNCTEVIALEWKLWLLFLTVPASALTIRVHIGHSMSNEQFLFLLTVLNWTSFIVHAMLLSWISYQYRNLRDTARLLDDTDINDPLRGQYNVVSFALQFMSLFNTFLLAFFMLVALSNNLLLNTGVCYILFQSVPLVIVAAYLFPVLLCRFSVLQGVHCPHPEVIGYILEQDKQFEEDLATLRTAYNEQGRPDVKNFVGDRDDFKKILKDMKIYLSNDRCLRLFLAMDLDRVGIITKKELDVVLSAPAAELVVERRFRSRLHSVGCGDKQPHVTRSQTIA